METIHVTKNKFYIGVNEEEPIGLLNYHIEGDRLIIEHVYVTKALRGQELGVKLVAKAVAFAREKRLKIIAYCSYAEKVLTENQDYGDVFSANNE
ncbi:GNAT family N-acetyltransferase [Acetobacterium carbinolicum]|jgi:predicted GNAT family acetyltransferase|uniref:GNAT family N-acetyltransferase n=1 Tax=Acetobacterium TaxID=33951 RepID=UPI000DBEB231|nr:GNAT family N-acetyltransferase [Acetobacterium sp. KB-1]AWW26265.1 N-acetyltransferase [Acetobacterium sp. KB-1]